jgi:hypothetical protein
MHYDGYDCPLEAGRQLLMDVLGRGLEERRVNREQRPLEYSVCFRKLPEVVVNVTGGGLWSNKDFGHHLGRDLCLGVKDWQGGGLRLVVDLRGLEFVSASVVTGVLNEWQDWSRGGHFRSIVVIEPRDRTACAGLLEGFSSWDNFRFADEGILFAVVSRARDVGAFMARVAASDPIKTM